MKKALEISSLHNNHTMYGSWDMECNKQKFLSFWAIFCPFTLLPGKSKFWKNERNTWRYYHFTHVYDKWKSYDVLLLRQNLSIKWKTEFLSFWAIFCPFTPLKILKIKILKKWKKCLGIPSFYTSVPKIMIIWCTVPEIQHEIDVIFIFHFGPLFALFFFQPKKSKF